MLQPGDPGGGGQREGSEQLPGGTPAQDRGSLQPLQSKPEAQRVVTPFSRGLRQGVLATAAGRTADGTHTSSQLCPVVSCGYSKYLCPEVGNLQTRASPPNTCQDTMT